MPLEANARIDIFARVTPSIFPWKLVGGQD
jgi:hypothetical protein